MDSDRPVLLVIFGAGASFDSADTQGRYEIAVPRGPLPPPLAVHLVAHQFDPISQKYPPAQPIIDRLRRRLAIEDGATSLEAELAILANDGSAARRAQVMAFSFYLHDVIQTTAAAWSHAHSGYTRYLTLLDEVADWQRRHKSRARVDVVTFNYDMLVDQALASIVPDWTFGTDLDDYISRSDFRLFKLHGSTQWSRVIPLGELETTMGQSFRVPVRHNTLDVATQVAAAAVSTRGMLISPRPPEANFSAEDLRIPALAVPVEGKMEFECPPVHVDRLKARLSEVTHVLIVGWRGAEEHAISLLDAGLSNGYLLGIVSNDAEHADETFRNLGAVGHKGRYELTVASGFSGLINQELPRLQRFLEL